VVRRAPPHHSPLLLRTCTRRLDPNVRTLVDSLVSMLEDVIREAHQLVGGGGAGSCLLLLLYIAASLAVVHSAVGQEGHRAGLALPGSWCTCLRGAPTLLGAILPRIVT
jgi:hypothetical protein